MTMYFLPISHDKNTIHSNYMSLLGADFHINQATISQKALAHTVESTLYF